MAGLRAQAAAAISLLGGPPAARGSAGAHGSSACGPAAAREAAGEWAGYGLGSPRPAATIAASLGLQMRVGSRLGGGEQHEVKRQAIERPLPLDTSVAADEPR